METYRKDEIVNRHNQRIYYFSKQPGKTELEKCMNMNKSMKIKVKRYDAKLVDGKNITCIVYDKCVEVFNDLEEKIGEIETGYKIRKFDELIEYLDDIGINVKVN